MSWFHICIKINGHLAEEFFLITTSLWLQETRFPVDIICLYVDVVCSAMWLKTGEIQFKYGFLFTNVTTFWVFLSHTEGIIVKWQEDQSEKPTKSCCLQMWVSCGRSYEKGRGILIHQSLHGNKSIDVFIRFVSLAVNSSNKNIAQTECSKIYTVALNSIQQH